MDAVVKIAHDAIFWHANWVSKLESIYVNLI